MYCSGDVSHTILLSSLSDTAEESSKVSSVSVVGFVDRETSSGVM